jgi:hypothetical protein
VAKPRNTFDARITELQDQVGHGVLRGELVRDQAYAQKLHEDTTLRHPRGGQAKFQESALLEHHEEWLQYLAGQVLDGDLEQGMADVLLEFDASAAARCPRETGALAGSGAPRVVSAGRTVWSRPPAVPRQDRDTRPGDERGGTRRGGR